MKSDSLGLAGSLEGLLGVAPREGEHCEVAETVARVEIRFAERRAPRSQCGVETKTRSAEIATVEREKTEVAQGPCGRRVFRPVRFLTESECLEITNTCRLMFAFVVEKKTEIVLHGRFGYRSPLGGRSPELEAPLEGCSRRIVSTCVMMHASDGVEDVCNFRIVAGALFPGGFSDLKRIESAAKIAEFLEKKASVEVKARRECTAALVCESGECFVVEGQCGGVVAECSAHLGRVVEKPRETR